MPTVSSTGAAIAVTSLSIPQVEEGIIEGVQGGQERMDVEGRARSWVEADEEAAVATPQISSSGTRLFL